MELVRKTLKEARLGAPRTHSNLAVFPLWTAAPADRPYMTLDEALTSGKVRVTEVSQHGSVPDLCLVNDSDRPVLLLDGEELRGAKQDRVLNLTILAPAGKTIVVPVSCVESGRWGTAVGGVHEFGPHPLRADPRREIGPHHRIARAYWTGAIQSGGRVGLDRREDGPPRHAL